MGYEWVESMHEPPLVGSSQSTQSLTLTLNRSPNAFENLGQCTYSGKESCIVLLQVYTLPVLSVHPKESLLEKREVDVEISVALVTGQSSAALISKLDGIEPIGVLRQRGVLQRLHAQESSGRRQTGTNAPLDVHHRVGYAKGRSEDIVRERYVCANKSSSCGANGDGQHGIAAKVGIIGGGKANWPKENAADPKTGEEEGPSRSPAANGCGVEAAPCVVVQEVDNGLPGEAGAEGGRRQPQASDEVALDVVCLSHHRLTSHQG
eukprot:scaffold223057_cov33-Tisochrysis_lutea.AAC.1